MSTKHIGECGHPVTKANVKRCRKCWSQDGNSKLYGTKTHYAKHCGHKVSGRDKQWCQPCYNAQREIIAQSGERTRPTPGAKTLDVKGDSAELGLITDQHVRTLADLIKVCDIDTDEWEIERWVANKWEMGAKDDATGEIKTRPLFQIKAWLKRNRTLATAKAVIAGLLEDAKRAIGPRKIAGPRRVTDYMLEVAVPDLHLGKLAWAPETGRENYDSKIAADLFREAIVTLIARTSAFRFERVVFPVGNDFFHSDNVQGTTTKGTPVDTDGRFHKTFVAGRRLISWAIDRLRTVAPVEVVIVPGNHDQLAAFHLGDSLACLYHKTKGIVVRNEPIARKYVSFGRNLIMFTHGHAGKKSSLPLLMATEMPELFGRALFREAHVGHTHETHLQEHMGVRVRVSPALCAADAWHSENHYVGNLRRAEAIVWSKTEGDVATASYTVIADRPKETVQVGA